MGKYLGDPFSIVKSVIRKAVDMFAGLYNTVPSSQQHRADVYFVLSAEKIIPNAITYIQQSLGMYTHNLPGGMVEWLVWKFGSLKLFNYKGTDAIYNEIIKDIEEYKPPLFNAPTLGQEFVSFCKSLRDVNGALKLVYSPSKDLPKLGLQFLILKNWTTDTISKTNCIKRIIISHFPYGG